MTVLRGPADADHYRVKIGRYNDRWYHDPLPADDIAKSTTTAAWPSVTTVKKASGNDWTFVGLKRVAQAMRDKPDQFDGLGFDEIGERLRTINKLGLTRAGERGTQVHRWFERGLRGEPLEQPFDNENAVHYLPAIHAFFDTYQPELVAAELVCINRRLNGLGYGGTADALIRIDGRVYWPDWKSRGEDSDHGAYSEEAAQVGGYSMADYYIAESDNGPIRVKHPSDVEGGLIVSVKPDGCRIYPIDLDKAQRHWTALHAWWVARRTEKDAIGKPWAPRSNGAVMLTLHDQIAAAPDQKTLRDLWATNRDVWTQEHTYAARVRKTALETEGVSA